MDDVVGEAITATKQAVAFLPSIAIGVLLVPSQSYKRVAAVVPPFHDIENAPYSSVSVVLAQLDAPPCNCPITLFVVALNSGEPDEPPSVMGLVAFVMPA